MLVQIYLAALAAILLIIGGTIVVASLPRSVDDRIAAAFWGSLWTVLALVSAVIAFGFAYKAAQGTD